FLFVALKQEKIKTALSIPHLPLVEEEEFRAVC
ncbi:hypothetical protein J2T20_003612, partial [Paenibacillus wynnii]|nr:hypothetical protein [Paenibacillus wynnii]